MSPEGLPRDVVENVFDVLERLVIDRRIVGKKNDQLFVRDAAVQ
jgi:hypothetical protein